MSTNNENVGRIITWRVHHGPDVEEFKIVKLERTNFFTVLAAVEGHYGVRRRDSTVEAYYEFFGRFSEYVTRSAIGNWLILNTYTHELFIVPDWLAVKADLTKAPEMKWEGRGTYETQYPNSNTNTPKQND